MELKTADVIAIMVIGAIAFAVGWSVIEYGFTWLLALFT